MFYQFHYWTVNIVCFKVSIASPRRSTVNELKDSYGSQLKKKIYKETKRDNEEGKVEKREEEEEWKCSGNKQGSRFPRHERDYKITLSG